MITRSLPPTNESSTLKSTDLADRIPGEWGDNEYFLLFRVCNIFMDLRKQNNAAKVRRFLTIWKFNTQQLRRSHQSKGEAAESSILYVHRSNFLSAMEDFDKISEALRTEQNIQRHNAALMTNAGGAKMLISIWRYRLLRIMHVYFQRWVLESKHAETVKRLDDLRVNLQNGATALQERQTKSNEIEMANSRLQVSLLVVISVLRLRTHSFLVSLYSSRVHDAKLRKQLFLEMVSIKEALKQYSENDIIAKNTAAERGKESMLSLRAVQENTQIAKDTQQKLKLMSNEIQRTQREMQTNKEILDRKAGVASNGGSG